MRVLSLVCGRYRKFKEKIDIPLAPITLVIGKNGSGKSIISRLPLLLGKALSKNPEGILSLSAGDIDHAATFQDLVHGRGALPFTLGAEISGDGQLLRFEASLRYVHEIRGVVVERFELWQRGELAFSVDLVGAEELTTSVPRYSLAGADGRPTESGAIFFAGLLPNISNHAASALVDRFREVMSATSYLGPFRIEPELLLRVPSQQIHSLGPKGERALEMLADDQLRRGGELSRKVAEWFKVAMGSAVEMDVTGERPRVRVSDREAGIEVSLSDTGAGFSQSLPVAVQHLAFQSGRLNDSLLIVEQPELHLHPAAHGAIADLIAQSAREGATSIVETHSEQLIMRIRRRIAEGNISPTDVLLLSVDHWEGDEWTAIEPLKIIRFDERGDPDSWPTGVFEESLDDLRKLRSASRSRGV